MNTLISLPALKPAPRLTDSPAAGWLARMSVAAWRALEAYGRGRASRHLLDLASRYDGCNPSFAHELRSAARQPALRA